MAQAAGYAPIFIALFSMLTAIAGWAAYFHARRRHVVDTSILMISKMSSDQYVADIIDQFRELRGEIEARGLKDMTVKEIEVFRFIKDSEAHNAARTLKALFNFYESLALGIRKKWLSEEIIRDYCSQSYIADWLDFQHTVYDYRSNLEAENLFEDFEHLAYKWASEKQKPKFRMHSRSGQ
ncbi:DUF4760 domain-containing protein [Alkalicaulis satelles]|uniref:DUF4760 domain-containing protein n=1 Tax=Alkalicaulis satelles TaxID=2609175 RepID=A0A5M6ZPT7_9PROT|nr:DUF4760 domain-containing protein [Alkalicaulis satelles]KAA5805268.1 DUF4760 domain-containing protein [Alkalicaulis satelles]